MEGGAKMSVRLKEIGDRIRQARMAINMSQQTLAEKLDITPSYVSNLELGKNNFTVDKLIKLTEILGVSADWLLRSNIPESKAFIDQDIAELLKDCDAAERTALLQILISSKASIRDYTAKTENK